MHLAAICEEEIGSYMSEGKLDDLALGKKFFKGIDQRKFDYFLLS
jgi:hypothetical protein